MIDQRHARSVAAAVAAAALALPAAASAHPAVYQSSAPVNCVAPALPYTAAQFFATCTTQTRYVFTNHGNTYLLRETNGKTAGGAISYNHRPAGLAAASDFNIFATDPQGPAAGAQPGPTSGAQPHATCSVPALTTDAVIRGWQGRDPFYAYIPFQRNAAGLDDNAATWVGRVQTATGVNLSTVADTDAAREAACEVLPGATASSYAPADETQSTLASWSAGQVHLATAPLEEEIGTMSGELTALRSARAGETTHAAGVVALYQSAVAQIDTLTLALRPLKLTLPATIPSPGGLATDGIALKLAGPGGRSVAVRALITAAQAKKLGLKSRILGTRSVTLDPGGDASFTLKPSAVAAKRLAKATGPLEIAIEARTGDRYNLATATLGG